jgi:hypothetical protein
MYADLLLLKRGESTLFHVVVHGLEGLPGTAWIGADRFDLVDLGRLKSSAPNLHLPAAGEDGALLLTLRNGSPGTIKVPRWGGESTVIMLHKADFPAGQYDYTGTIVSEVSGTFTVSGVLTPLMAEEPGALLP